MNDFTHRGSRRRSRRAAAEPESAGSLFASHGLARRDHKTAQLCRQVFRALSLALGECGDDVLRDLTVTGIDPAPDASRLLVRVALSAAAWATPDGDAHLLRVADILARLDKASGFLRHEVAMAITRKRAPELSFMLAGPETEGRP